MAHTLHARREIDTERDRKGKQKTKTEISYLLHSLWAEHEITTCSYAEVNCSCRQVRQVHHWFVAFWILHIAVNGRKHGVPSKAGHDKTKTKRHRHPIWWPDLGILSTMHEEELFHVALDPICVLTAGSHRLPGASRLLNPSTSMTIMILTALIIPSKLE